MLPIVPDPSCTMAAAAAPPSTQRAAYLFRTLQTDNSSSIDLSTEAIDQIRTTVEKLAGEAHKTYKRSPRNIMIKITSRVAITDRRLKEFIYFYEHYTQSDVCQRYPVLPPFAMYCHGAYQAKSIGFIDINNWQDGHPKHDILHAIYDLIGTAVICNKCSQPSYDTIYKGIKQFFTSLDSIKTQHSTLSSVIQHAFYIDYRESNLTTVIGFNMRQENNNGATLVEAELAKFQVHQATPTQLNDLKTLIKHSPISASYNCNTQNDTRLNIDNINMCNSNGAISSPKLETIDSHSLPQNASPTGDNSQFLNEINLDSITNLVKHIARLELNQIIQYRIMITTWLTNNQMDTEIIEQMQQCDLQLASQQYKISDTGNNTSKFDSMVAEIETPHKWDNLGGSFFIYGAIHTESWPTDTALRIYTITGETQNLVYSSEKNEQQLSKSIDLLWADYGTHFDVINKNGQIQKMKKDGDCFFHALHYSLGEIDSQQLDSNSYYSAKEASIIALRRQLAAAVREHFVEIVKQTLSGYCLTDNEWLYLNFDKIASYLGIVSRLPDHNPTSPQEQGYEMLASVIEAKETSLRQPPIFYNYLLGR